MMQPLILLAAITLLSALLVLGASLAARRRSPSPARLAQDQDASLLQRMAVAGLRLDHHEPQAATLRLRRASSPSDPYDLILDLERGRPEAPLRLSLEPEPTRAAAPLRLALEALDGQTDASLLSLEDPRAGSSDTRRAWMSWSLLTALKTPSDPVHLSAQAIQLTPLTRDPEALLRQLSKLEQIAHALLDTRASPDVAARLREHLLDERLAPAWREGALRALLSHDARALPPRERLDPAQRPEWRVHLLELAPALLRGRAQPQDLRTLLELPQTRVTSLDALERALDALGIEPTHTAHLEALASWALSQLDEPARHDQVIAVLAYLITHAQDASPTSRLVTSLQQAPSHAVLERLTHEHPQLGRVLASHESALVAQLRRAPPLEREAHLERFLTQTSWSADVERALLQVMRADLGLRMRCAERLITHQPPERAAQTLIALATAEQPAWPSHALLERVRERGLMAALAHATRQLLHAQTDEDDAQALAVASAWEDLDALDALLGQDPSPDHDRDDLTALGQATLRHRPAPRQLAVLTLTAKRWPHHLGGQLAWAMIRARLDSPGAGRRGDVMTLLLHAMASGLAPGRLRPRLLDALRALDATQILELLADHLLDHHAALTSPEPLAIIQATLEREASRLELSRLVPSGERGDALMQSLRSDVALHALAALLVRPGDALRERVERSPLSAVASLLREALQGGWHDSMMAPILEQLDRSVDLALHVGPALLLAAPEAQRPEVLWAVGAWLKHKRLRSHERERLDGALRELADQLAPGQLEDGLFGTLLGLEAGLMAEPELSQRAQRASAALLVGLTLQALHPAHTSALSALGQPARRALTLALLRDAWQVLLHPGVSQALLDPGEAPRWLVQATDPLRHELTLMAAMSAATPALLEARPTLVMPLLQSIDQWSPLGIQPEALLWAALRLPSRSSATAMSQEQLTAVGLLDAHGTRAHVPALGQLVHAMSQSPHSTHRISAQSARVILDRLMARHGQARGGLQLTDDALRAGALTTALEQRGDLTQIE